MPAHGHPVQVLERTLDEQQPRSVNHGANISDTMIAFARPGLVLEGVGTTISDRTAIIGTRSRSGTAIRSLRAAPCTASRLRLPVRQCA